LHIPAVCLSSSGRVILYLPLPRVCGYQCQWAVLLVHPESHFFPAWRQPIERQMPGDVGATKRSGIVVLVRRQREGGREQGAWATEQSEQVASQTSHDIHSHSSDAKQAARAGRATIVRAVSNVSQKMISSDGT